MWLMYQKRFKIATVSSFLIVPPGFALMCWFTQDEGLDMFVIIYMLFCFFFLRRIRNTLVAFFYCFFIFLLIHFYLENEIGLTQKNTPPFVLTTMNYIFAFFMFFCNIIAYKISSVGL
jgi:hypothetical protein